MSIMTGKITMKEEFGIIEKMRTESESAADNYRSLQGYTTGSGDSQLFVMQKAVSQAVQPDADKKAKLVEVSYSNSVVKISSEKTNLQHGNDCAYYNGHYYVVTGNNVIYEFRKSTLERTNKYSCEGLNFDNVTCIAHISGNFFLLGANRKLAVCQKTSNKFIAQKLFKLEGDTSSGKETTLNGVTDLVRQGMYVKGNKLFKAYGKRKADGQITTNYIAKWTLNGSAPKYTSCTLKGMYEHTKSDKFLFEIESIGAFSNSMYAAVKIEDNNEKNPFKAKLYKISF